MAKAMGDLKCGILNHPRESEAQMAPKTAIRDDEVTSCEVQRPLLLWTVIYPADLNILG